MPFNPPPRYMAVTSCPRTHILFNMKHQHMAALVSSVHYIGHEVLQGLATARYFQFSTPKTYIWPKKTYTIIRTYLYEMKAPRR